MRLNYDTDENNATKIAILSVSQYITYTQRDGKCKDLFLYLKEKTFGGRYTYSTICDKKSLSCPENYPVTEGEMKSTLKNSVLLLKYQRTDRPGFK
jgi:C1A family cysteine protease